MAALEKSSPLDRRGSTEAGDGYDAADSGFGDTGIRFDRLAVLVLLKSCGGICKLNLRGTTPGLLGVTGPAVILRSSLEDRLLSVKVGDGDNMDLKSEEDQGRRLVSGFTRVSLSTFSGSASWMWPFSFGGVI